MCVCVCVCVCGFSFTSCKQCSVEVESVHINRPCLENEAWDCKMVSDFFLLSARRIAPEEVSLSSVSIYKYIYI